MHLKLVGFGGLGSSSITVIYCVYHSRPGLTLSCCKQVRDYINNLEGHLAEVGTASAFAQGTVWCIVQRFTIAAQVATEYLGYQTFPACMPLLALQAHRQAGRLVRKEAELSLALAEFGTAAEQLVSPAVRRTHAGC